MTANVRATKTCESCKEEYKPTSNRQRFCPICTNGSKYDRKLMSMYGVTRAEIDEAREEAADGCPLCGKEDGRDEDPQFGGFLGDHDHQTNVFRGFLCRSCNMAMGYIDNADWMRRALAWQQRGR